MNIKLTNDEITTILDGLLSRRQIAEQTLRFQTETGQESKALQTAQSICRISRLQRRLQKVRHDSRTLDLDAVTVVGRKVRPASIERLEPTT